MIANKHFLNPIFFLSFSFFIAVMIFSGFSRCEAIDGLYRGEDMPESKDHVYKTDELQILYKEISKPYLIIDDDNFLENELNADIVEIRLKLQDICQVLKSFVDLYNREIAKQLYKKLQTGGIDEYKLNMFNEDEKEQLGYTFIALLVDGKIFLKEKETNCVIDHVKVEYFDTFDAPFWTERGRAFKLPTDEIFLRITDIYY
jgi:hypothetical protein